MEPKKPFVMDAHNPAPRNSTYAPTNRYIIFEPHDDYESWGDALVCARVYVDTVCIARINGIATVEIFKSWLYTDTVFEVSINDVAFYVNEVQIDFAHAALAPSTTALTLTAANKDRCNEATQALQRALTELQDYFRREWAEC